MGQETGARAARSPGSSFWAFLQQAARIAGFEPFESVSAEGRGPTAWPRRRTNTAEENLANGSASSAEIEERARRSGQLSRENKGGYGPLITDHNVRRLDPPAGRPAPPHPDTFDKEPLADDVKPVEPSQRDAGLAAVLDRDRVLLQTDQWIGPALSPDSKHFMFGKSVSKNNAATPENLSAY